MDFEASFVVQLGTPQKEVTPQKKVGLDDVPELSEAEDNTPQKKVSLDDVPELRVAEEVKESLFQKEEFLPRPASLLHDFLAGKDYCEETQRRDLRSCQRLGSGAVAKVFKTEVNHQDVAAKVLRVESAEPACPEALKVWPTFADDFVAELRVVRNGLDHPNVTKFIGTGISPYGGKMVPVILYEFMEGGSVEDLITAKKNEAGTDWAPKRDLALSWCRQLLSGLAFLHTCDTPMAHRDIKPGNVLLSGDLSTLKLADFSLAMPLSELSTDVSEVPSIAGSFRYMAPEVFMQDRHYGLDKADLYSAAVTCWSMIYAERPFAFVESPGMLMTVVRQGIRPVVPSKDSAIAEVLNAAWDADPDQRPTAQELETQLQKLENKQSKRWSIKALAKSGSFSGSVTSATKDQERRDSLDSRGSLDSRRSLDIPSSTKATSGRTRRSSIAGIPSSTKATSGRTRRSSIAGSLLKSFRGSLKLGKQALQPATEI